MKKLVIEVYVQDHEEMSKPREANAREFVLECLEIPGIPFAEILSCEDTDVDARYFAKRLASTVHMVTAQPATGEVSSEAPAAPGTPTPPAA